MEAGPAPNQGASASGDAAQRKGYSTTQEKAEEMVEQAITRNHVVKFMLQKLEEVSRGASGAAALNIVFNTFVEIYLQFPVAA